MHEDLDWSGIPDDKPGAGKKTEFEVIPEGTALEARLIGMKPGKTQNDKKYYEAEFLIVEEGDYQNRHVWTRLYTDKGANFKMRDLMKALDLYKPEGQKLQLHELLQKQFQIVIGVNNWNPEKPRNEAKFINTSRALGANQGSAATVGPANSPTASGGSKFKLPT